MRIDKLTLACLMAAALPAGAGTIITVTGPTSVGQTNPAVGDSSFGGVSYSSWTMGSTSYTGAAISAALWYSTIDPSVTAYLLEGTSYNTATEIASNTVVVSNKNETSSTFIQLFSGLSLTAGDTYFLVISDIGTTVNWESSSVANVDTTGATNNAPDYYLTAAPYDGSLPGSQTGYTAAAIGCPPIGQICTVADLLYEVNGTPVTQGGSTPEPASMALVGGGLGAFFLYRRRRA